MTEKSVNERALRILKTIVERYIRGGQPVGSKAIAEEASVALSSASIRNIMADLEAAGYLQSPHTSAGRIPTIQGYRLFVDTLLKVQPLNESQVKQLQEKLNPQTETSALVGTASALLSNLTKLAGIVTVPRQEHITLRQVEFLPLSQNRILAVLVFSNREIQNRIIYSERQYTNSELQQAGNYLTQTYASKSLLEIRHAVVQSMQTDRENMQTIMHTAMNIAGKAFESEKDNDYVIAGEANLLTLAEQAGINRLRSLFEALTQKRTVLDLLDECLRNEGIKIFIGKESGYDVFEDCSIITAPYSADGKTIGVLGVIGPTRMDYDRVISAVDVTAKLLSAALSE